MKSMSEAAGLTGKHTNYSVRRTMISILRAQNVEPLDIIALTGQRNLKPLDSYSSTSMRQQKDMSVKLSKYIQAREAPEKSLVESQVQSPRPIPQQNENRAKQMFAGAVFHNCRFNFTRCYRVHRSRCRARSAKKEIQNNLGHHWQWWGTVNISFVLLNYQNWISQWVNDIFLLLNPPAFL